MKTAKLTAVTAAVLLLAGCINTDPTSLDSGQLAAQYVDLPDGRVVTCVYGPTTDAARAIDCDWATATREGEQP